MDIAAEILTYHGWQPTPSARALHNFWERYPWVQPMYEIEGISAYRDENLMELLLMLDAAKRASARHITAVIPYFGWARQDRKDKPRVPIAAKLVAKMLETAGATRIITMDLHADQIQGFFEKPVDHMFASTIFLPYLRSLNLDNLTIASPDMGGSKRAYAYSKALESDVVLCYKQRAKANVISHMELIGDVTGKNVVLVDDMVTPLVPSQKRRTL